ncbi:LysE family transporter [Jeotgalibacillus malaysiensis]|uniref:LysE family transporter n=1 Tax=Jeotgalibacillus malaysiensis TaxID=1508404 RepID=UPI00384C1D39
MGILGTVLASTITQKQSFNSFLFVASGIIVGILIHDVALSFIVHYSRQLLNQKAIKWVSIIAGILLIGFSFYFGYEFILELQSMH